MEVLNNTYFLFIFLNGTHLTLLGGYNYRLGGLKTTKFISKGSGGYMNKIKAPADLLSDMGWFPSLQTDCAFCYHLALGRRTLPRMSSIRMLSMCVKVLFSPPDHLPGDSRPDTLTSGITL